MNTCAASLGYPTTTSHMGDQRSAYTHTRPPACPHTHTGVCGCILHLRRRLNKYPLVPRSCRALNQGAVPARDIWRRVRTISWSVTGIFTLQLSAVELRRTRAGSLAALFEMLLGDNLSIGLGEVISTELELKLFIV